MQLVKRKSRKAPTPLSKDQLIDGMKAYLPQAVTDLFEMQIKHAGKAKLQWSEKERQQALKIR